MRNYIKLLKEVKKMLIDEKIRLLEELKYSLNKHLKNEEEWDNWDSQIEKDSEARNLDFLIEEALIAKTKNQLKDL